MKQFNQISLKEYHSFHTNEKVHLLSILESSEEAETYLSTPSEAKKRLVIGEGSNLLFSTDYDGEIIKIENKGIELMESDEQAVIIKVAAGENWDDLVKWTTDHNFGGLENLSYIPGTVGAAPVQNIGAYGVEFKDVFHSLECIDLNSGEKQYFTHEALKFDYRYSIFKGPLKNKYLITSVCIKLSKNAEIKLNYGNLKDKTYQLSSGEHPKIKDVREAVIAIRKSKLPEHTDLGNAGSFFKNPIISLEEFQIIKEKHPLCVHYKLGNNNIKLAAAWLIENSGLKGFKKGNAATHAEHALILINTGNASGSELKEFSEFIQKTVFKKYGVQLEAEVLIN